LHFAYFSPFGCKIPPFGCEIWLDCPYFPEKPLLNDLSFKPGEVRDQSDPLLAKGRRGSNRKQASRETEAE
jgi:hypothetical protein